MVRAYALISAIYQLSFMISISKCIPKNKYAKFRIDETNTSN